MGRSDPRMASGLAWKRIYVHPNTKSRAVAYAECDTDHGVYRLRALGREWGGRYAVAFAEKDEDGTLGEFHDLGQFDYRRDADAIVSKHAERAGNARAAG